MLRSHHRASLVVTLLVSGLATSALQACSGDDEVELQADDAGNGRDASVEAPPLPVRDASADTAPPSTPDADSPDADAGDANADADGPDGDAADADVPDADVSPGLVTFPDPPVPGPAIGGDGGTAFAQQCPAGEAIVGIRVRYDAYLLTMQALCAPLIVSGSAAAWSLKTGSVTAQPVAGTSEAEELESLCPVDQVVVSVAARAGDLVDALTLGCAPITIGAGEPPLVFTTGAVTEVAPVGGDGGNVVGATICGAGAVVTRVEGGAGDGLDGATFSCQALAYP